MDTNVVSEAAKVDMDPRVRQWLSSQVLQHLHTTAVNLAEVSFGIESMVEGRRKDTLGERMWLVFRTYLADRILPFDESAARVYGRIVASAQSRGRSILIADGQIAAIAHVHGFTVATRDTAPFEAAGVPVINPWAL